MYLFAHSGVRLMKTWCPYALKTLCKFLKFNIKDRGRKKDKEDKHQQLCRTVII